MAHDVFVSYPNVDKATADAVVNALESEGIRCWVAPRDVLHGQDWAAAIVDAIESAKMLVLVFSDGTNQSDHILREVRAAGDAGLTILPFRTTEAEPTAALKYYIGGMHWLDAMSGPMEQHLVELVATVRRLMPDGVGSAHEPSEAMVSDERVGDPDSKTPWWARIPRRASIGTGAVIGLLLILGAIAMFGPDDGEPTTTLAAIEDETTTTAAATTTTAVTTTTADTATTVAETTTTIEPGPSMEWVRVEDEDLLDGVNDQRWSWIRGIAYDGSRFVAIGDGPDGLTAWGSTDGTDWSVLASGGALDTVISLHDVVAAGPGFVAVGTGSFEDGDRDAAVMTSIDGTTWTRVDGRNFLDDGSQELRAVATDGSVIVAVGFDQDGSTSQPLIWRSTDGRNWSRMPYSDVEPGWREMTSVAVVDGLWVAADSDGSSEPTIWLSSDGVSWHLKDAEDVTGLPNSQGVVTAIAGGPDRFLAIGSTWSGLPSATNYSNAAAWVSEDGLRWTRVDVNDLSITTNVNLEDAVFAGDALVVAAGSTSFVYDTSSGTESHDASVWTAILAG